MTHSGEGPDPRALEEVRGRIARARGVCILTGAGVSAESGVPTFRGEEGLWKSHSPEELATPSAFRRDPRLVWEWYEWRRGLVRQCRPNPGHEAIARFALSRGDVRVVTQNVDGLHAVAARQAAGARDPSPALPLELHGSLFRVRCTACRYGADHRSPLRTDTDADLPRCPVCAALLRPAVVWFGESLDPEVLDSAFEAVRKAEVCLVVGTSSLVQPAASLPLAGEAAGANIVEVNPVPTPLSSRADHCLRGPAGAVLPRILEET